MKVNVGIVKQFTDVRLSVDELVSKVNAQLGVVEEVINIQDIYKDAVIVRVVECKKHANADKLSVCMVDAGQKDLIKVVCGAPNVHADMWAIWLPPNSIVPSSYNDAKPFVLDAREIRGEMSHGMLAAADELAIGTDHSGIIELTDADLDPNAKTKKLQAGQKFAEVFGLDHATIDIENKMFTHRPDLFGQLGVAREIAGIQQHGFTSPSWYVEHPAGPASLANEHPLAVSNGAEKNVSRFMVAVMDNVVVAPSPMWLQCQLIAMGGKPINNVVDITNYIMLVTSQPTHAYDYDTLHNHEISSRMAKKGESVKLLNGKTYTLSEQDIVIADGKAPIGLAGIMGGSETEVSSKTTTIVLEVANFDMYTVRKSSMNHGIFTDALTRFNKGQSPRQNAAVMHRLIALMSDVCGAKLASTIFDAGPNLRAPKPIELSTKFINERLGSKLAAKEISKLLENVECKVEVINKETLRVTAPFWRTDIEIKEDVVEEVGRLHGFDSLPIEVPLRPTSAAPANSVTATKRHIRETMKLLGANELLTYSFVNERVLIKAEQNPKSAFKIYNALSPDLQYYRLNVLPSLLDKVHANIKSGHDSFVLYEIGKGHNKLDALNDEGLPVEQQFVDAVYANKKADTGASYFVMRRYAEQLINSFGVDIVCKPIERPMDNYVAAPFDQARSSTLETADGLFLGIVGELKPTVVKNFKLPASSAAMSLDFESLCGLYISRKSTYQPLSRYPSVTQDISLKVPGSTKYADVYNLAKDTLQQRSAKELRVVVTPMHIYWSDTEPDFKTVTLRISATSYERTLSDKDVSKLLTQVEKVANNELRAERA